MVHNNEYLVRIADDIWQTNGNIESSKKYDGSGYYRMIFADSFEEAIEKWNNNDCPNELKRVWGECGMGESLVMVINHKGQPKFYM